LLRRALSWLLAARAWPIVFPVYLLWRDVVEIDGQRYRFNGLLRRFRNEQALRDYLGRGMASKIESASNDDQTRP
jgi:hypothetical protein